MEKKSDFWFGRIDIKKMGKGWQRLYLGLAIFGGLLGLLITMGLFEIGPTLIPLASLLYAGLVYIAIYVIVFIATLRKYYKMSNEEYIK